MALEVNVQRNRLRVIQRAQEQVQALLGLFATPRGSRVLVSLAPGPAQ